MKTYKALKDVPYYGIKAGMIYETTYGGASIKTLNMAPDKQPLIELGAIEPYNPLPRLTVDNIKDGEKFWHVELNTSNGADAMPWDGSCYAKWCSRFGMFRTQEEAVAHFNKLCEYSDKLLANDE